MARVDAHAHVVPPRYGKALGQLLPPVPAPLDGLKRMLDQYGIARAIVSTGPPGAPSRDIARIANEELADIARAEPGTFAVLAALPLGDDVDVATEAVEHAYDELGMDGVLLLSNVNGRYLGDPALEPLFAELDRRSAYAFLHPGYPPHALPLDHPVWLYEFTFETTRALANLIYSGTLHRYPHIRLQAAHLGGTTPFVAHRLASLAGRQPDDAVAAPDGALEYLHRLYYDTGLAANAAALASTLEVTTVDHVVFGTDWPYADLPDGDDPAPDLSSLGADRRLVDGLNIEGLFPRWSV